MAAIGHRFIQTFARRHVVSLRFVTSIVTCQMNENNHLFNTYYLDFYEYI